MNTLSFLCRIIADSYVTFSSTSSKCDTRRLLKPLDLVIPNDQDLLGVRVKLQNLKGKKDLNGQVGHCGCWFDMDGRYQVFLPPNKEGQISSALVKPSNLHIANAMTTSAELGDLIMANGVSLKKFPSVIMSIAAQSTTSCKVRRPILDEFLDPPSQSSKFGTFLDTYHGPVSRRAQAILRTVAAPGCQVSESMLSCAFWQ